MRLILISVFVLALGGCTVIQDVEQFQEDFACGVDIRLREYTPHALELTDPDDVSRDFELRERFGVYVVQERRSPGADFRREYIARAFFDPLPAPNVDIRLPFAVDASETGDQRPATLELHADVDLVRTAIRDGMDLDFFEFSDNDHSWIFPHACSEEGTIFPHVRPFDPLEPADESDFGLKVVPDCTEEMFSDCLGVFQEFVDTTIEVRVVRESARGTEEIDQARAFYRRGGADRTILLMVDGEMREVRDIKEDAEIDLGGVLAEEDSTVIVFMDRNGNGIYDTDDIAVDVDLDLGTTALPFCDDEGSPPDGDDACKDGDDIVVEVPLTNANNNRTLVREAWWTYVPPTPEP